MTLLPFAGAMCCINNIHITEPTKLSQGCFYKHFCHKGFLFIIIIFDISLHMLLQVSDVYFFVRPEAIACRAGLCFSPDVFFSPHEISEMHGPTGVKFCTMVTTRPNFIMPVQNLGGRTPKKFQGPKTCKIWPDFRRLRSSVVNLSLIHISEPTRPY